MNKNAVKIGERIKSRREQLKIKQCELAELLDISNNHMSSIERGTENPSIELLLRICAALKVTPDYVLLGNMHSNDVGKNITDSLRLCSEEDKILTQGFVELLVKRNADKYNKNEYV